MQKPTKINKNFTLKQAQLIVDFKERKLVQEHLAKFNNDPLLAFDSKTLKNEPLMYKDAPLKEVSCFEEIFTIRKDINSDNFKNDKHIEKIVDEGVKKKKKKRLLENGNDYKKAFSDLNTNPIYLNEEKGITIKRATITGVSNAEPLHTAKDHFGELILDNDGKEIPVDYVELGNNHHIAIYQNPINGELKEEPVSFYLATQRRLLNNEIVNKRNDVGWPLLFTLKQNEMFVFPNEDFEPKDIDLMDQTNFSIISPNLFRVQSISSKYYIFRHHLETTAAGGDLFKNFKNMSDITYRFYQNEKYLQGVVKVRINHIGQIVEVGEY